MGSITTGIGLISGIDTATLINNLIALESQGKVRLQERLSNLQKQQGALLDINARLLNLKNAAASFRTASVFDAATAVSSNDDILTASATGAQPGTFQFIVKQLVSTSQKLSKGFANIDSTPVGLTSLTFEVGNGKLSTDTALADLNGAAGVRRGGIVVTDSNSNVATIDLGAATSVGEVLKTINDNPTVSVTAAVVGDHIEITDTAGGAGTLSIANAVGDFTAADLGIAKTAVGGTITGDQINLLSGDSALSGLNDGTGVLIRRANPDIKITARDGTEFDIDFGRIDAPITDATKLSDLNNGLGVTLNDDSDDPDIKLVDRMGTEYEVDLTGLTTVGALRNKIDSVTGGNVTITIHGDGDKLVVNDNTGAPSGLLKVQGAGPNGTETAEDLGILQAAGVDAASFDGSLLANADFTPAASTIQEIIDRINNAKDTLGFDNAGHVVASIGADGVSLRIDDTIGGGGNLVVASTVANPYAARDLGIEVDVAADNIDGTRLTAGINSRLVRSLNGGAGLSGNLTLDITDRQGDFRSFALDENASVSDIIALINDSADTVDVVASLNEAGNGLLITDTSGSTAGNLVIANTAAGELGIAADVAADSVRGTNIQLRYVSESSRLEDLNFGRGVGSGKFILTDGEGQNVTISIGSDAETLYDVINEINGLAGAAGVDVTARVNDNGDGLLLENTLGTGIIRVDTISGTFAADLRLDRAAASDGEDIDGSYETTVSINASDTVNEIVSAINSADVPVSASILNSGAGPTPYQITFSSDISGRAGDLLIDDLGFGLKLKTLSAGRDAQVFFGADDPADGILIERSTNKINDVVQGLTLDLVSADSSPVSVTVARDTDTILEDVDRFVETFNEAIGRIDQYDFYNIETETKGPLLGNGTTGRIRSALFRAVQGKATGIDTKFQRLSDVGISVGSQGVLNLDRSKFLDAYEDDPEAVENLFAAFKGKTVTTKEIAPGVTADVNEQTYSTLGFGDLFDQLLDGLTNSVNGAVTTAGDAFQDQINSTKRRIEDFDDRLDAKRTRLEHQFAAMETALASLQEQSGALLSLSNSLALSQSLLAR